MTPTPPTTVTIIVHLERLFEHIGKPLIGLLFGIAFVIFIWGIVEFIRDAGSDEGRKKGWLNILWGSIGMVIMISVYTVITIVAGTIGVEIPTDATPTQQDIQDALPVI